VEGTLEYKDLERKQQIARWWRLVEEGVRQANNAARVSRFSQVYLRFFVLANTLWVNGGRYTYDGPDSFGRSEVALSPTGLDSRIGVMRFEWVRPMDRPSLGLATYGSSFEVPATRIEQSELLNLNTVLSQQSCGMCPDLFTRFRRGASLTSPRRTH
jgi:hypothetical protein